MPLLKYLPSGPYSLVDVLLRSVAIQRFLGDDLKLFESWIDVLTTGLQGQSLQDVERSINALRRSHALQAAPLEQLIGSALGQRQEALSKAERLNLAIELAKAGQHTHMQISQMTGVARVTPFANTRGDQRRFYVTTHCQVLPPAIRSRKYRRQRRSSRGCRAKFFYSTPQRAR